MIPVIEEQTRKAIHEATSWYTVAIDVSLASKGSLAWGTGSILKFQERLFILTCEHVVQREYKDEEIRYLFRDDNELKGHYCVDNVKNASLRELTENPETLAVMLPLVHRFYSDEEDDDLVLLELDPRSELFRRNHFYPIELNIKILPKEDVKICLLGFPTDFMRDERGDGRFGCFPYFLASRVVDKELNRNVYDYNKEKHFLIEYEKFGDKIDNLRGISGCGIWTPSQLPQEVWTANLRLLGVQTGFYEGDEVLKATRIEKVIELLESI
jgi:hypothetical protein